MAPFSCIPSGPLKKKKNRKPAEATQTTHQERSPDCRQDQGAAQRYCRLLFSPPGLLWAKQASSKQAHSSLIKSFTLTNWALVPISLSALNWHAQTARHALTATCLASAPGQDAQHTAEFSAQIKSKQDSALTSAYHIGGQYSTDMALRLSC